MTEWDGTTERRQQVMRYQQEILEKLNSIDVELRLMRPFIMRVTTTLYGNGKDGLVIESDRTKRTVNTICWVVGVFSVAVIGMLVKRWMG